MDIKIHTKSIGLLSSGRGRIAMNVLYIKDEEGKELGFLTGDQLLEQLRTYNFDIVDLKAKKVSNKTTEYEED